MTDERQDSDRRKARDRRQASTAVEDRADAAERFARSPKKGRSRASSSSL
jgi:hypothetical protein